MTGLHWSSHPAMADWRCRRGVAACAEVVAGVSERRVGSGASRQMGVGNGASGKLGGERAGLR